MPAREEPDHACIWTPLTSALRRLPSRWYPTDQLSAGRRPLVSDHQGPYVEARTVFKLLIDLDDLGRDHRKRDCVVVNQRADAGGLGSFQVGQATSPLPSSTLGAGAPVGGSPVELVVVSMPSPTSTPWALKRWTVG